MTRTSFAIRSLNIELSQVLDLTSTPTTAKARFLFWSAVIDDIYSSGDSPAVHGNPVASELKQAILAQDGCLSKRHFKKLVDTRLGQIDRSSFPFDTLKDIEAYSEGTLMPAYYLLIESWSKSNDKLQKHLLQLDHTSSHVSKSLGIVNVLRGTGHNAQRQRCYLPSQVLMKHGVSQEDILRYSVKKEVQDACYDVACAAKNHLDIAFSQIKSLKPFSSLFLHVYYCQDYLSRLEKENFNVFSSELHKRSSNLPFKLWTKAMSLRYF